MFSPKILTQDIKTLKHIDAGYYNYALILPAENNNEKDKRVLKVPKSQDEKVSKPDRFVRKWNLINNPNNNDKNDATLYLIPADDKNPSRYATSVPFITGEDASKNDSAIASVVLDIYKRTRTVILDPFIENNILRKPNGEYICIDFDLAYHRASPTVPLLEPEEYYESHAWNLIDPYTYRYAEEEGMDEDIAQERATEEVRLIVEKEQAIITEALKNRIEDTLALFIEKNYLEMEGRTAPPWASRHDLDESHPITSKTIKTILYMERHLPADNIIDDYLTANMINEIHTKYYLTKTPVTADGLNQLLRSDCIPNLSTLSRPSSSSFFPPLSPAVPLLDSCSPFSFMSDTDYFDLELELDDTTNLKRPYSNISKCT